MAAPPLEFYIFRPPRVEGLDDQKTKSLIRHHTKRLRKLKACPRLMTRIEALEAKP